MAGSIGVRVYKITLHERGDKTRLPFDTAGIPVLPPAFITQFLADHTTITQSAAQERSWFFEECEADAEGNSKGYVHYGTFGFESNLIDTKTRLNNYRRKATDIEEIPLFYEFWCPDGAKYGFAAFQSFQGRSCISLVMTQMRELFEKSNPKYILKFRKLVPTDKGAFGDAQVRRLRLIRKNAPSDVTDRYYSRSGKSAIDVEISISARRNGSLGILSNIRGSLRTEGLAVVAQDGDEYTEAIADIRIGNKIRPVGVFGISGDAGVIDLTDLIVKGADGHPTYDSMAGEVNDILVAFHETLAGDTIED